MFGLCLVLIPVGIVAAVFLFKWFQEEDDIVLRLLGSVLAVLSVMLVLLLAAPIACGMTSGLLSGYSQGEQVGYVTNLSQKGFIWKTWEGQMQTGQGELAALQEPVDFSVLSEEVLVDLRAAIESGQRIRCVYTQWIIMPYRIGSSGYLVERVEVLGEKK